MIQGIGAMEANPNPPSRSDPAAAKRSGGGLKPAILSLLAYSVARFLGMTWRLDLVDESCRIESGTGEIFLWAIWHNRIGIMPAAYKKYMRRNRLATLVSASRDGELLARTLTRFGFQPVRGSSSRRGPQSLREMVRWVAAGYDAVITPDGPRGPAEIVQPGIVQLAKITGLAITPVSCSVSHCIRLKSWDRFMVPWPFARCRIHVGPQISVPEDANPSTLEGKRLQLQEELKRLGKC